VVIAQRLAGIQVYRERQVERRRTAAEPYQLLELGKLEPGQVKPGGRQVERPVNRQPVLASTSTCRVSGDTRPLLTVTGTLPPLWPLTRSISTSGMFTTNLALA